MICSWSRGRRAFLQGGAAVAVGLVVGAHAPYGQWGIYRKRYLLILTTRADPLSFEVGKELAAILAGELPASKAKVSRAPDKERIASLLSSKQLDIAVMRRDDAAALRLGVPPFAGYGPLALETIVGVGEFLLVCRDDFPARHAWLIAEALFKARARLALAILPAASTPDPPEPRVPLHLGSRGYFSGAPLPDDDPEQAHEHEDGAGPEAGSQAP